MEKSFDSLFKAVTSLPGHLAPRAQTLAVLAKRANERGDEREERRCLDELGTIAIQSEGFAAIVKAHRARPVEGHVDVLLKHAGRR